MMLQLSKMMLNYCTLSILLTFLPLKMHTCLKRDADGAVFMGIDDKEDYDEEYERALHHWKSV